VLVKFHLFYSFVTFVTPDSKDDALKIVISETVAFLACYAV